MTWSHLRPVYRSEELPCGIITYNLGPRKPCLRSSLGYYIIMLAWKRRTAINSTYPTAVLSTATSLFNVVNECNYIAFPVYGECGTVSITVIARTLRETDSQLFCYFRNKIKIILFRIYTKNFKV